MARIYPEKKTNMQEVWKKIKGYEEDYEISNLGNIKSFKDKNKPKIRKPSSSIYRIISLCKNGEIKSFKCSRLVAIHFLDNPLNHKVVNHIDGNKLNDRVDNLEWCSYSENSIHYYSKLTTKENGYFGVVRHKNGKWIARVERNKIVNSLGCYDNIEDAKKAVDIFNSGDLNIVKKGKGIHNKGKYKFDKSKILEIIDLSKSIGVRKAALSLSISPTTISFYKKEFKKRNKDLEFK